MYCNGVFYLIVNDDFVGVFKIVEWMFFVFDKCNNFVFISFGIDIWDCDVVFILEQKKFYDVRWMIVGKQDEDGFQFGLFDKDFFVEIFGGWVCIVVVGCVCFGGIFMGVIGVEICFVENIIFVDFVNFDLIE